jgi:hypothetical protein
MSSQEKSQSLLVFPALPLPPVKCNKQLAVPAFSIDRGRRQAVTLRCQTRNTARDACYSGHMVCGCLYSELRSTFLVLLS